MDFIPASINLTDDGNVTVSFINAKPIGAKLMGRLDVRIPYRPTATLEAVLREANEALRVEMARTINEARSA